MTDKKTLHSLMLPAQGMYARYGCDLSARILTSSNTLTESTDTRRRRGAKYRTLLVKGLQVRFHSKGLLERWRGTKALTTNSAISERNILHGRPWKLSQGLPSILDTCFASSTSHAHTHCTGTTGSKQQIAVPDSGSSHRQLRAAAVYNGVRRPC